MVRSYKVQYDFNKHFNKHDSAQLVRRISRFDDTEWNLALRKIKMPPIGIPRNIRSPLLSRNFLSWSYMFTYIHV